MTTGHPSLDDRLRRGVRFFGRGGGTDVPTLSLLVLTMSLLLVQNGLGSPVGIVALALQAGLLVRINHLHGASVKSRETDVKDG